MQKTKSPGQKNETRKKGRRTHEERERRIYVDSIVGARKEEVNRIARECGDWSGRKARRPTDANEETENLTGEKTTEGLKILRRE